jgi:hypothetical protein
MKFAFEALPQLVDLIKIMALRRAKLKTRTKWRLKMGRLRAADIHFFHTTLAKQAHVLNRA